MENSIIVRKNRIKRHLHSIAKEVLAYIKEKEALFPDRWVPSSEIKKDLGLNYVAVPQENTQYGRKGWLFAIVARMLEDDGLVEYKKNGNRAYYRSKKSH